MASQRITQRRVIFFLYTHTYVLYITFHSNDRSTGAQFQSRMKKKKIHLKYNVQLWQECTCALEESKSESQHGVSKPHRYVLGGRVL